MRRDAAYWARRIRMSTVRTWAIVEGSHYDTPYYEGVLTHGANTTTTPLEAEDILIDGLSAGGKAHSLKVLSALRDLGALQQENRRTKIDVIVFVDRDDDDFLNKIVVDPHLHYTSNSDVEADIVAGADLVTAIARSYSIPRSESETYTPATPHESLATRWAEWITLRLASAACEWSDTRFAQPSSINVPKFEQSVDASLVEGICGRVRAASPSWDVEYERAKTFMRAEERSGRHGLHVKGKWLAPFISHEVERQMSPIRAVNAVNANSFLASCLGTIDFPLLWSLRFGRLQGLLSR